MSAHDAPANFKYPRLSGLDEALTRARVGSHRKGDEKLMADEIDRLRAENTGLRAELEYAWEHVDG